MNQPSIFLSYVKTDQPWADKLSSVLSSLGAAVYSPNSLLKPGEDWQRQLREVILAATHTLVLIGPTTRLSKWVDREIEISTELREDGPGAGLIGVILPPHDDFFRPYYDPENVPIRLHDLVQNEYAIVRKWSENPEDIGRWLDEAGRRRQSSRPEPSLGAAAEIYRFSWNQQVDEARPSPEAL